MTHFYVIRRQRVNISDDHSALTWKNFVWNLVKAQPIRRSSSCRASTLRASFSFGFPRLARAALISFSVIAEKWARNTTYKKNCIKYLGKQVTLQNFICKSSFSLCSFHMHKSAFIQFINLGMPSICATQKNPHLHSLKQTLRVKHIKSWQFYSQNTQFTEKVCRMLQTVYMKCRHPALYATSHVAGLNACLASHSFAVLRETFCPKQAFLYFLFKPYC